MKVLVMNCSPVRNGASEGTGRITDCVGSDGYGTTFV